jgi:hypothetical protein
VLKAAMMPDARSKVKNVSVVGRKGKAGLEALAVTFIIWLFLCLHHYKEKQLQLFSIFLGKK